ncbi:MAG: AraC family transcriptional regulator [Salinivirgaceae bacterium]|nr:AraC family transcriptional regulator [Salinivirgaceae bacterium]
MKQRIASLLIFIIGISTTIYSQNKIEPFSYAALNDSISRWEFQVRNNRNVNNYLHFDTSICIQKFKKAVYTQRHDSSKIALMLLNSLIKEECTNNIFKGFLWLQKASCYIQIGDADSLKYCFKKAEEIFIPILNSKELALFYNNINKLRRHASISFSFDTNIIQRGINAAEKAGAWDVSALLINKATECYRNNGNYIEAQISYNKSLEICDKHHLEKIKCSILPWSFEIHEYINDTVKILRDLNLGMMLCIKYNDSIHLAKIHNTLGRLYKKIEAFPKAIDSFNEALKINILLDNPYRASINYLNLGDSYQSVNNIEDAIICYKKSVELCNTTNFHIGLGFCYIGLMNSYLKLKNYQMASFYSELAKKNAKIADYHRVYKSLFKSLINYYVEINETDSCLFYSQKLHQLKDSIDNIEIHKTMVQYESQMKEDEIQSLEQKKNLLASEIENNKLLLKNKQVKIILSSIFSLLLFIALIALVKVYKAKEKAYSWLVKKNIELVDFKHNKEVTKSTKIKYPIINEIDKDLANRFMEALIKNKKYTLSDISLDHFTDLLNTNRTYLSKAINVVYKNNFTTVINECRVKEAIRMMTNSTYDHLSIEGIGMSVGFQSKSSFNRAFKSNTGLTPSDFKNNSSC